jgi:hypothetical protein
MTLPYFYILIGGASVLFLILIIITIRLYKRLNLFTRGAHGASLESTMRTLLQDHETSVRHHHELSSFVKNIHNRVTDSHRGFSLIKYNAFDTVGGNQSFSLALLDEKGTGMVLSSLYNRERSNIFAKPITSFSSEIELTPEEQLVLSQAKAKL